MLIANPTTAAAATPGVYRASDYGAAGDGTADDAPAIRAALAAAAATGGVVHLDPGKQYRINSALSVPAYVTLVGLGGTPHYGPAVGAKGSATILPRFGSGSASGDPALTLGERCGLIGAAFQYPDQPPIFGAGGTPAAYPPTVRLAGGGCTVMGVSFAQSYWAIDIPAAGSEADVSRVEAANTYYRGVTIDGQADTTTLRACNFFAVTGQGNPAVDAFIRANLTAFDVGRTDNLKMADCSVFWANVGYGFRPGAAGSTPNEPWVSGTNLNADICNFPLAVTSAALQGIQLANFGGTSDGTGPIVTLGGSGANYRGPLIINGATLLSAAGRYVSQSVGTLMMGHAALDWTDRNVAVSGNTAIVGTGGEMILDGLRCYLDQPQVDWGSGMTAAVATNLLVRGAARVTNAVPSARGVVGTTISGL